MSKEPKSPLCHIALAIVTNKEDAALTEISAVAFTIEDSKVISSFTGSVSNNNLSATHEGTTLPLQFLSWSQSIFENHQHIAYWVDTDVISIPSLQDIFTAEASYRPSKQKSYRSTQTLLNTTAFVSGEPTEDWQAALQACREGNAAEYALAHAELICRCFKHLDEFTAKTA